MSMQVNNEIENLENITLPRGSGCVIYIKRNTQHPYCARRYLYTDKKGNSHSKDIGYYKTRGEANRALLDNISKSALDIRNSSLTFSEVYDIWYPQAELRLSEATMRAYRCSFRKCAVLHDRVYASISAQEMQRIISNEPSATSQQRIRDLLVKLDHAADSMDIILKKRSEFLVTKTIYPIEKRVPFSEGEIERLWEHVDEPDVCLVLFLIYTAFRSDEACSLLKEYVNLNDMTITGGAKTPAGTMRIVPIHPRIQPYVRSLMQGSSQYLLPAMCGGKMYLSRLESVFKCVTSLYCDRPHIPHECRHTMQSRLDAAHADRVCINKIMGHKPANVSDRIYSHRTVEELRDTIMQLK